MRVTKSQLEELYKTKSNKEVCQILGVSMPTLLSYLKSANIPLKGSGNRTESPRRKLQVV